MAQTATSPPANDAGLQVKEEAVKQVLDYMDKVGAKVGQVVEKMAEQLGVASEHVYEVLVRQQIANGITLLLENVIFIGIMIFLWWFFIKKAVPWVKEKYDYLDIEQGVTIVGCIILLIMSAFAIYGATFEIPEAINMLVNPEYYAMKEITTFIENLANH